MSVEHPSATIPFSVFKRALRAALWWYPEARIGTLTAHNNAGSTLAERGPHLDEATRQNPHPDPLS